MDVPQKVASERAREDAEPDDQRPKGDVADGSQSRDYNCALRLRVRRRAFGALGETLRRDKL